MAKPIDIPAQTKQLIDDVIEQIHIIEMERYINGSWGDRLTIYTDGTIHHGTDGSESYGEDEYFHRVPHNLTIYLVGQCASTSTAEHDDIYEMEGITGLIEAIGEDWSYDCIRQDKTAKILEWIEAGNYCLNW